MRLEITWTFKKEYSPEEFNLLCQESNDGIYLGYQEIIHDYKQIDSSDDMHLQMKVRKILNETI